MAGCEGEWEREILTLIDAAEASCLIQRRLGPRSVCITGDGTEGLAEALSRRGIAVRAVAASRADATNLWDFIAGKGLPEGSTEDVVIIATNTLAATESTVRRVVSSLEDGCCQVLLWHPPSSWEDDPEWKGSIPLWASHLATVGLVRDLAFEAAPFSSQLLLFRRREVSLVAQLASYEHHLQMAMMAARSSLELARAEVRRYGESVSDGDLRVQHDELVAMVAAWRARWQALESGLAWPVVARLQALRSRLAPEGSAMAGTLEKLRPRVNGARELGIAPVREGGRAVPPETTVDVVVCVHNALEDVRRCLDSVVRCTSVPYSLILVDDGSDHAARQLLAEFTVTHGARLIRNAVAHGYTVAANQGLRASSADRVVLLNSDTVVVPDWLGGLLCCAASDDKIGLVGPLSNTASWQSIPKIAEGGDWARNALPNGLSIAEMGRLVRRYSPTLYPGVPFLNGFCLMLRRRMLEDVGYLDEEMFGEGYGEEDDLAMRARKHGWKLAVADDVYVYHAQSRSYSDERRHRLSARASQRLIDKHGRRAVDEGVAACVRNRVMEGVRARSSVLLERRDLVRCGASRHSGRRVLFVLPVATPGGGANVVLSEARAMLDLGVTVKVFNLSRHRAGFQAAYPHPRVPVVYGSERDLASWGTRYDAVVATHNESASWLAELSSLQVSPVLGYYVQGFEPLMYPLGSEGYQRALESYQVCPGLVRMAKTEWVRQQLHSQLGLDAHMVWPSFEVDRFCPRLREDGDWPDRRLRVAAMIRPDAPYRSPGLTMRVLREIKRKHRRAIDIWIFGADPRIAGFDDLPHDFHYTSAGILGPRQVAGFLNEVDVFLDLSEHQAMGLTAMEAMGCGAAVVVPENGGADTFVTNRHNGLVVDTTSADACLLGADVLATDHALRQRLQANALQDIVRWFPERSALAILDALFGREGHPVA